MYTSRHSQRLLPPLRRFRSVRPQVTMYDVHCSYLSVGVWDSTAHARAPRQQSATEGGRSRIDLVTSFVL